MRQFRIHGIYALRGYDMTWMIGTENWSNPAWSGALAALAVLSVLLVTALYGIRRRTVRIYNWNGKRYRYLGRAKLYTEGSEYLVKLDERMADLSYTTLYQICPAKEFVRRNRYRDMVLRAGAASSLLHVDTCMRKSIYYRP